MAIFRTKKEALEYVNNQHYYHVSHGYDWFTEEAYNLYKNTIDDLPSYDHQDISERRDLRIELQRKYGLTELEALNVVNGIHVYECIQRYYMIKQRIPLQVLGDVSIPREDYD